MNFNINNIAKIITEDPDILNSVGYDLTANSLDTTTNDEEIKDKLESQQEEDKSEIEQQKNIEPYIRRLKSSINQMDTEVKRGISNSNETFEELDDDILGIQDILSNLEDDHLRQRL